MTLTGSALTGRTMRRLAPVVLVLILAGCATGRTPEHITDSLGAPTRLRC